MSHSGPGLPPNRQTPHRPSLGNNIPYDAGYRGQLANSTSPGNHLAHHSPIGALSHSFGSVSPILKHEPSLSPPMIGPTFSFQPTAGFGDPLPQELDYETFIAIHSAAQREEQQQQQLQTDSHYAPQYRNESAVVPHHHLEPQLPPQDFTFQFNPTPNFTYGGNVQPSANIESSTRNHMEQSSAQSHAQQSLLHPPSRSRNGRAPARDSLSSGTSSLSGPTSFSTSSQEYQPTTEFFSTTLPSAYSPETFQEPYIPSPEARAFLPGANQFPDTPPTQYNHRANLSVSPQSNNNLHINGHHQPVPSGPIVAGGSAHSAQYPQQTRPRVPGYHPPQQERGLGSSEGVALGRAQVAGQPPRQPAPGHRGGRARGPVPPSAPNRTIGKRNKHESSDDESSDEDEPSAARVTSSGKPGAPPAKQMRLPGACTHCKKLKMKCEFPENENTCKRCKNGGHVCVVEGRKQRVVPNKREQLLAQLREKEATIASLLKQIHNPNLLTPLSVPPSRFSPSAPSVGAARPEVNANIIEWMEKAQKAVPTDPNYMLDGRAFGDTDESSTSGSDDDDERIPADRRSRSDINDRKSSSPKLHSLPMKDTPFGLFADLSLDANKSKRSRTASAIGQGESTQPETSEDADNNLGLANETYFKPGPAANPDLRRIIIARQMPPEILVHGLVSPDEVDKLFKIFFEKINIFVTVLDPAIHTPATIFGRCPFLFTVVCAISSRYYTERPELYPTAMHYAKTSAASTLIDGWKSVELCQAYILMSLYPVPARRWEEDRTWLYLGLAIRMATDLNLHRPTTTKPLNEQHEREILNRTRTWLICFNLDRSSSSQFGKPSTIREDFIVRNSKEWYKRSRYNMPFDVHLCSYTTLLRIVSRFQDEVFSDKNSPTGLNKNLDFKAVTSRFNEELSSFKTETALRFQSISDASHYGCRFRTELMPFLVNYSRLVMFSFGFQEAFQNGLQQNDFFLVGCLDAASSVVKILIENLAPFMDLMRYSPDGHFVFASFASAFLLKLLRPEFKEVLDDDQRARIIQLVGRLIKVLGSKDISVDERHTPKLYARFLAGLLAKHAPSESEAPPVTPSTSNPPPSALARPSAASPTSPSQPAAPQPDPAKMHRSTPSIEISPAPPLHPLPPESPHRSLSPQTQSPSQVLHVPNGYHRPPSVFEDGNSAASTIQPNDETATQFSMDDIQPSDNPQDLLAAMYAVSNPAFWQDMMMPGFTWDSPPANWDTSAMDTDYDAITEHSSSSYS